mgnify:CR=1 FL=1
MDIKELGELLNNARRISINEVRVGDIIYNDEGRGCARYGEIEYINKRGDLISKDGTYVTESDYIPEANLYLLKKAKTPLPTEIGSYIRITDKRPRQFLLEGVVLRLNGGRDKPVWQVGTDAGGYYAKFFEEQNIEWEQVWLSTKES